MTALEKRLYAFAKLVHEFIRADGNEIIQLALHDKMAGEFWEIISEFIEKKKGEASFKII